MSRSVIVVLASLALALPSCSVFRDVCTQTAASRASAAALVADAQLALDQAEIVITSIASGEVRSDAMLALRAAQSALRAAAATLAGTHDACAGFDLAAAFSDFREAWAVLAPFLALLGGPGGSSVRAPLVVSR